MMFYISIFHGLLSFVAEEARKYSRISGAGIKTVFQEDIKTNYGSHVLH
jgi:hypothetical protein